ncbi:MAG: class II fumarate hydratase [Thermoguttaceae bacterium]
MKPKAAHSPRTYYGQQTKLAIENFPISGETIPRELIHSLGLVKWAAAMANYELGRFRRGVARPLTDEQVAALLTAARDVAEGDLDDQFPVDLFQTGSGTSSNMNANEVIASRANELQPSDTPIHPNDHVNCGQSTNDIFPTAIHVATAVAIQHQLVPVLTRASKTLQRKATDWCNVIKIGRTHLTDATPMTLGQEVSGWARQFELAAIRAAEAVWSLLELPVGGTAVGTGINTHRDFASRVCHVLASETGIPFVEATNHFEANSQRDSLVACHATLKVVATSLFSVANNIRLLSSGPRCGFYEISLSELQAGSSIMPGKVNPVLCESAMQVAACVIGNDQTITLCGASGGQFQLNIMMPLMASTILESVRLLTSMVNLFDERCLATMEANEEVCRAAVERSLSLATPLNAVIGYEAAAALVKEAFKTGKTIRELAHEKQILPPDELDRILDPHRMTTPDAV